MRKPWRPGAVVGELALAVKHEVDDLLAGGVVAAGVVVGRVLLAGGRVVERGALGSRWVLSEGGGWLRLKNGTTMAVEKSQFKKKRSVQL